jgi:hypothetical protein
MPGPSSKPLLKLFSQDPALEAAFAKPPSQPSLGFSLLPGGLPLGAITHLSGPGRTRASLQFLAEHPEIKAGWVEERLSAYPPGFAQAGVDLEKIFFVQAGAHLNWALSQVLRSGIFQLVVAASPVRGELELRRLQLATEKSGTALLLLAGLEGPAWPVKLWVECEGNPAEGLKLVPLSMKTARKAL